MESLKRVVGVHQHMPIVLHSQKLSSNEQCTNFYPTSNSSDRQVQILLDLFNIDLGVEQLIRLKFEVASDNLRDIQNGCDPSSGFSGSEL